LRPLTYLPSALSRYARSDMGNIGAPELLIVLVIALVILGPKRLPEAGRSLGKGLREFKDSVTGTHPEDQPKQVQAPSDNEPV
jgi:sec-independent protein translocase protein TatA